MHGMLQVLGELYLASAACEVQVCGPCIGGGP